jgi:hypothetical protein
MIEHFLPQNPREPIENYAKRKQQATYLSYVGPIVDYFTSWLFSGSFTVRAKDSKTGDTTSTEQYYNSFQEDVGGDCNLNEFMRLRFTDALIEGCAHWLIRLPDADPAALAGMSRADYDTAGLGTANLLPITRDQLWDWECDDYGKLRWCVIHEETAARKSFKDSRSKITEKWTVYEGNEFCIYAVTYEAGKRPGPKEEIPLVQLPKPHRFKEIPLVSLRIDDGLWIGERVAGPQVEHFRLMAAKSHLIRQTCYAMPILFLENDQDSNDVMGAGYWMKLGHLDKFEWTAPPNTPFDVISKDAQSQRDEIYRIVHQMAQGLDNNAETVGRSADSKAIDTAATRIMLNAYGSFVRKAIEETFEILSDSQGDDTIFWSIEGFEGYDTATVPELMQTVRDILDLHIPSKTLRREVYTKAGLAVVPNADVTTRDTIKKEIRDAVDSSSEIDELELPTELHTKIELQKMKDETHVEVEDKKMKAAKDVAKTAKAGSAKPGGVKKARP